ncbi:MAG: hypothetical protein HON94_00890 [Methylococcales bacterium]|jgi:conjugal transfer pilus assembly protein TraE|nr:hypothetical protein [Methylococcales bacterium]
MHLDKFKVNYSSLLQSDRNKTITIILLAGSIMFTTFMLFNQKERIVIIPPTLSEKAWIETDNASKGYKKGWGLYFAQLMGNVSPGNVEFVQNRIQEFMSSSIYHKIKKNYKKQAKILKDENLTIFFHANLIKHEQKTDKVFVHGNITTIGAGGDKVVKKRTYEYKIAITNFTPQIVAFNVYSDVPHTEEWRIRHGK